MGYLAALLLGVAIGGVFSGLWLLLLGVFKPQQLRWFDTPEQKRAFAMAFGAVALLCGLTAFCTLTRI